MHTTTDRNRLTLGFGVIISFRRWILPVTVLLVAACSDTTTPLSAPDQADGPHFLRWAPSAAPRFEAIGAVDQGPVLIAGGPSFDLTAPALTTYQASFWAVRGETRQVQINYLSNDGEQYPYLRLETYDPTWVPGRGNLAMGDSVLITIQLDPQAIAAQFFPSGLQFGTSSDLQFWYSGVGGDLNGDGVVDRTDATIENRLLGMWHQETPASPWTEIASKLSKKEEAIRSAISHFSGYAVSW